MKSKLLYLDTNEASHATKLKKGDRMVVVRPLKEQPPKGYDEVIVLGNEIHFCPIDYTGDSWHTDFRYPGGVELTVKESWGTVRWSNCAQDYVYKSDGEITKSEVRTFSGWSSSITMPKEAVRINFKVMGNRVDKCENITMNEATLTGIKGDPMQKYCPDYPAYYLYPYITKKYGKKVWGYYTEIITLEGFNV